MPSVNESVKTPLAAGLAAGVNTLSLNQTVRFTKYVKLVLPLDGFIFWVKADLLSQSAVINSMGINGAALNQRAKIKTSAPFIDVQGSLHYATTNQQNEDETVGVNNVIFTALSEIKDFNNINDNIVYLARLDPDGVLYSFNARSSFYAQADLYHYLGTAVYPAMLSQIIEDSRDFDRFDLVVSNSLPFWLAMIGYQSPVIGLGAISFPVYPSFAVPANLPPPYATIHIDPPGTMALQSSPVLDSSLSHWQLLRDIVRITIYGVRNAGALNFLDFVNQYSRDTDNIGIMNMPVVRDDKRTQSELNILAMKKIIDFEVSYYQTTARDVARQFISSSVPSFTIRPL